MQRDLQEQADLQKEGGVEGEAQAVLHLRLRILGRGVRVGQGDVLESMCLRPAR